jgi:hypothetical protein
MVFDIGRRRDKPGAARRIDPKNCNDQEVESWEIVANFQQKLNSEKGLKIMPQSPLIKIDAIKILIFCNHSGHYFIGPLL